MARLYILIFVLAILAGIGYGAYFVYNDTMQRMATLRDNNAKLEVAVKSKDVAITALKENMEKQIKLTKNLNNKLTIAEENNKKISNLLAKTDIIKNSLADPIGQEKRINEQVNKMFGGINAATK
jgi:Tfp pilus assembly protein PilO|tara:strand:- start:469 stop:843 length:375 start_codon:yes stop_codon:yes gene_type:complete